jgi:anti-sigma regulatory factor (Ser/Thr protein kinase)
VRDAPLRTSFVVSAESSSSRSARAAVRELCSHAAVPSDTSDVAELLVSELVTNAQEHAGGPAVVDVQVDDRSLRVAVADQDPTIPIPRELTADAERGRGLLLVAALASRWGATPAARGKSVWFELDRA